MAKYKNDPIIEAVCEFSFVDAKFDAISLYSLHTALKKNYPKRRQVQIRSVQFDVAGKKQAAQVSNHERVQFLSEDETALVQVDHQILAVNRLRPYLAWEKYLPKIRQAYTQYKKYVKPELLSSISLRYINQIEVPNEDFSIDRYFNYRPVLPKDANIASFGTRVDMRQESPEGILRLQLKTIDSDNMGTNLFLLDLNYISRFDSGQAVDDSAIDWLKDAKVALAQMFEDSITDELRKKFN